MLFKQTGHGLLRRANIKTNDPCRILEVWRNRAAGLAYVVYCWHLLFCSLATPSSSHLKEYLLWMEAITGTN